MNIKYIKIKNLILSTLFFIMLDTLNNSLVLAQSKNSKNNDMEFDFPPEMAQELENFMTEFNNLPDEEKRLLEDLSNQIETMMQEEGLDPSNPEELIKWLEKQESEEPQPEQKEKKEPEKNKPVTPIVIEATENINDTAMMLDNLNKTLALFRQKASLNTYMNNSIGRLNLELNEFTYFLNILKEPDIIKYLISKEFQTLYKNLIKLSKVLDKNEKNINIIENLDQELNPYEVLGLSSHASNQDIEKAYKELKELYDSENLRKTLRKENLSEKEIEKKLKQAKLSFSFIQNAYDSLKDPKEKAQLDKNLRQSEYIENQLEKNSLEAFEAIKLELTNSLFNILSDIKKLLEKYKPEELAKAKAQEELEKKILEESKKTIALSKSPPREKSPSTENEYKEFWNQMNREAVEQQYAAQRYQYQKNLYQQNQDKRKPLEERNKPKPTENKPQSNRPESKPNANAEPKKETPKEIKKNHEQKQKETAEFIDNIVNIKKLDELFSNVKDYVKIEKSNLVINQTQTDTNPNKKNNPETATIKKEKIKIKLDDILKDLNSYLKEAPIAPSKTNSTIIEKNKDIIVNLREYFHQAKIKEIWLLLKTLIDNIGKEKNKNKKEEATKELKKLIKKHKKIVENWYNKIYKILNLQENKNINPEKSAFHGLSINEYSIKDINKDAKINPKTKARFNYLEGLNLAKYRKYVNDIKTFFDKLEKQ